jgi:hypothetical protein
MGKHPVIIFSVHIKVFKIIHTPGTVVNAYNPSTKKAKGRTVSSKLACIPQQDSVSKNKMKEYTYFEIIYEI